MAPGPPRSLRTALDWLAEGRRVVAATLVETLGSAPLDPGAEMLVDDGGRIEGSVTGGCVEGALVEEAHGILAGAPPRVATYGISDEQAVGVGLMCGGTVRVFVHELGAPEPLEAASEAIADGRPVAVATLLDGAAAGAKMAVLADATVGSLGHTELLDDSVARDALGFLDEGRSAVRRYSAKGETMGSELRVAIHAFATPPRMVIFGAIDFSAALAEPATAIGYRVTIVDARAGVRAGRALPRARRGRRVVAGTVPGRRVAERARRGARVHARPEVRRACADRRAGHAARATSARSAAAAPTPTARSACAPPA